MKVMFFTKYSRKGASSRYRTYQYLSYLRFQGLEVDVSPLFGDEYLAWLYAGDRIPKRYLLMRLLSRVRDVLRASKYDVIVVEKELLPHVPSGLEHVLRWLNPNIVADYDDAIFANYQNTLLLKRKIATVIRLSKAVNAGNSYLASYAREFNTNVNLIPTVVDLDKYESKRSYEIQPDKVVIGWIGTPITSKYLFEIKDALSTLAERYPITLRCIGTSHAFTMKGVEVENITWEESTEASKILTFDIGIMPLTDDPFARGKCGLKLIQYMACGIPAIASPVGVNKDIICNGENGLLAGSEEEWVNQVSLLIQDRHLRKRIGIKGRQTVRERYSLEVVAPQLLAIYRRVARGQNGPERGI